MDFDCNSDWLPDAADLPAAARLLRGAFVLQYRRLQELASGVPSTWGSRPIPQWDGGVDDAGRHRRPIWPRVAQRCVAERLDPLGPAAGGPIRPDTLLGRAVIGAYHRDRTDRELRARSEWAQQEQALDHFAGWIARPEQGAEGLRLARRATLTDRTRSLSALYRSCKLADMGEAERAAQFLPAAILQYLLEHAAYDRAWGGRIPRGLRDGARAALEGLGVAVAPPEGPCEQSPVGRVPGR